MRVVVPFAASDPKTRLSPVLDAAQRHEFSAAMLRDVLEALSGRDPEVLADAPVDDRPGTDDGEGRVDDHDAVPVTVDERDLTPAVNAILAAGTPVAVVMADLPLATPEAVARLFEPGADVTLAPGLGGGTNAMVVRHPDFRADYHGPSIRDHREAANEIGATVAEVDSFRLATDVDEPADLAEVVLHGEGHAARWLAEEGFEITVQDGRVGVRQP